MEIIIIIITSCLVLSLFFQGLYWNDDQYSGCKKTVWNPYGNGMISMDIPFPIVIVSNASDEKFILRNVGLKYLALQLMIALVQRNNNLIKTSISQS